MPTDLRSRQRERTREDILAAAWELAGERGIAELSLRDLAARVGMRAPSLYGYFDGKGAIYDALFAAAYRELDARSATWPLDDGDRAATLREVLVRWLAFCVEDLPRYQLMYTRVVPGWEPSPDAYAASVASYERFRDAMLRVGVTDPHHLDLWTAISSGLAAQQVANEPGSRRWIDLADQAVSMFLAHVDTHGSTP